MATVTDTPSRTPISTDKNLSFSPLDMQSPTALQHNADTIQELQAELVELRETSRELEAEMELELEDSYKRQKHLDTQVTSLTADRDLWKQKFMDLQKEYTNTHSSLSKRIATLEKAHRDANNRLREIEMENDDMERSERITKSTLEDLENKYHNCLEEIAMLEADVAGKQDLVVELQRTKDELRDTKEELAVSRTRVSQLEADLHDAKTTVDGPVAPRTLSSSGDSRKSSVTSSTSTYSNQWPSYAGTAPTKRLTSSRSLLKIHGMLDQMRSLESRVATFKSTLPRVRTPKKGSPASLKRSPSSPCTSSLHAEVSSSTSNSSTKTKASALGSTTEDPRSSSKHGHKHKHKHNVAGQVYSQDQRPRKDSTDTFNPKPLHTSNHHRNLSAVDTYGGSATDSPLQSKSQIYSLGHRRYGSLRHNPSVHNIKAAAKPTPPHRLNAIQGSPSNSPTMNSSADSLKSSKFVPLKTRDTNTPASSLQERPGFAFSAMHSRFGPGGKLK